MVKINIIFKGVLLVRGFQHGIKERGHKMELHGVARRAPFGKFGQTETHPRVQFCHAEATTKLQAVVGPGNQVEKVLLQREQIGLTLSN